MSKDFFFFKTNDKKAREKRGGSEEGKRRGEARGQRGGSEAIEIKATSSSFHIHPKECSIS